MTPRHSRLHQPAVGLLPRHYLIGEGVSVPELLSAPLSSFGGQPATLMAAAPVRQRSGPGGQRAQLPPCYYEGYLEKRGPKEKVGSPGAHQLPYFGFGASCRCWKSVCVCVYMCVWTAHRLSHHSQRAVNFLIVREWVRRNCTAAAGGDLFNSHSGEAYWRQSMQRCSI